MASRIADHGMDYNARACRVLMGAGAIDSVAEEVLRLGGSRVLLVCGRITGRSALVRSVTACLGKLLVARFDEVVEHSRVPIVEQVAGLARSSGADLLLAIGGGSASDTAKAAAILLAEGGPLEQHANRFTPPDRLVQQDLRQPKLPILAIPTTASAAEVTPGLGVKSADGHKLLFWDDKVAARTVILDPAANLEVPAALMATSGMNALAHCIEGLYSKRRNPIAEGLALQGLRLLGDGLRELMGAPGEIDVRARILYGAHASGMVIASTRTCIHHGLCHSLGAPGGLPHGVANSVMLPHAMRFLLPVAAPQLKLAAQALGADVTGLDDLAAAERAIDEVRRIQLALRVPARLRDTDLAHDSLAAIARHVMGDRALFFTPGPPVTQDQLLAVLEAAW